MQGRSTPNGQKPKTTNNLFHNMTTTKMHHMSLFFCVWLVCSCANHLLMCRLVVVVVVGLMMISDHS